MKRFRVPGSTSNLGAGFDCMGIALDLWLEVELVKGTGEPVYSGTIANLSGQSDLIWSAVGDELRESGMTIRVNSNIPTGKGLGSSGAAAVAVAILSLRATNVEIGAVYERARKIEGHPDNAGASVYGGAVLIAGRPVRITVSESLALALAIPESSVSTRSGRKVLPESVPLSIAVEQARRSAALIMGLERGERDLIAFGMEDKIAVPTRVPLIPGFADAAAAAFEQGAYGVTISGSGSGVVAVCGVGNEESVASAMAGSFTSTGNAAKPLTPGIAPGYELFD